MKHNRFTLLGILLMVMIVSIIAVGGIFSIYHNVPTTTLSQNQGVQQKTVMNTTNIIASTSTQGKSLSAAFEWPYPFSWKEQGNELTYWLTGVSIGNYPGNKLTASYREGEMVHAIALTVRIDVGKVLATTDIRMVKTDGSLLRPNSAPPYLGKQGNYPEFWNVTLTSDIVFIVPQRENDFTFRVPSVAGIDGFDYFRVYLDKGTLKVGPARG